jgi:uncharacterized delta-60 repeat protein
VSNIQRRDLSRQAGFWEITMSICAERRRAVSFSQKTLKHHRRVLNPAWRRVFIENLEARTLLSAVLDPSFGGDGSIETAALSDFAVQADNKILGVANGSGNGVSATINLYRFNANGTADTTYGSGGVIIAPVPFAPQTMLIVGDKIYGASGTGEGFRLARYNLNGSLDTTFAGDGVAEAVFEPFFDQPLSGSAYNIFLAPDGDIIVGGSLEPYGSVDTQAGVARFNPDGTLDTTFGGDGTVSVYISPHSLGPSNYTQGANGDIFTTVSSFDYSPPQQYDSVARFHRTGYEYYGGEQPVAAQSGGQKYRGRRWQPAPAQHSR